ncbi:trypsin inhibitor DE-3-like [Prosopis cineraria]|uniref:trypsin inhibitor DE-3-like n=1 Tax=Prosopis cineraria TaxID=364024 RepID=UPI00240FEAFB|nr:trypsin inhibitor DE-3-like [Prosopis cineraria]
MKPVLFSLFVLLAFSSSSATSKFVLDSEGNELINGGTYYILPHIWALGGGLRLAKTGNETCPLSVVQSPFEVDNGFPWTIRSPLKIRILPLDSNVDFFSVKGKVPSCVPIPSVWTMVEEDGLKSVKIAEYEKAQEGWFRIQQYTSIAYKIVFCPINGDSCRDLGISRGNDGKSLLVITNDTPLYVVFIKAESSDARRASIM